MEFKIDQIRLIITLILSGFSLASIWLWLFLLKNGFSQSDQEIINFWKKYILPQGMIIMISGLLVYKVIYG